MDANKNQAGSAVIEFPVDLKTHEGIAREIAAHTEIIRDFVNRGTIVRHKDGGYTIKGVDEEMERRKREEDILARLDTVDKIVKANASRFSASASDQVTLSKAAMVLQPDEDLKSIDRTYLNVMQLTAAELAGVCQLDAHRIPGLEPHVRAWGENPQNRATVSLIDRLHQLNDRLVMKYWWLSCNRSWRVQNPDQERAMRSFKEWPEYERLWNEVLVGMGMRAMDETTASKGLNLVPVQFSGSIADMVEAPLRIAALIPSFTMTSKTFEWPVLIGHNTVYSPGEGTGDHATYDAGITAGNPTFGKPVWTAKKLAALCFVSTEVDEDAIEGGVGFAVSDMARSLGIAKEFGFVNGEKAGSTMDGATFNPATGARGTRFVNGFRFHALMTGSYPAKLDQGGVAISIATSVALQAAMGAWGVNPSDFFWGVGFRAYHSMRLHADYRGIDKVGANAAQLAGMVGTWEGSPVILSGAILDNNATGVFDGVTTNRGSVLGINPSRWAYGDRRGITVDTSEHVAFRNDQVAVRGTLRGDLHSPDAVASSGTLLDATHTPVGIIYNIA